MAKKKACYIFGAGDHYGAPPSRAASEFVIAADGGYEYLRRFGVDADMLIGDFDSLEEVPPHPDLHILPREKDDTDMVAAIHEGWDRGYRNFHIYGGTGGRLDHTLANIQCIADLAGRGGRGFLYDRDAVITAVKNDSILFPAGCAGTVSVFSHSDTADGVYEEGFTYPLVNATLRNNYPLGISNEFTGNPGSVRVTSGTLIVIYPHNVQEVEK